MPSATVGGSYASINTIFDPPKFSLDTTFKVRISQNLIAVVAVQIPVDRHSKRAQLCQQSIFLNFHQVIRQCTHIPHLRTVVSIVHCSNNPHIL
jgi:hypothetical protein